MTKSGMTSKSSFPLSRTSAASEAYMDLSVSTPTLFDKISYLDLYDGDFQCQIKEESTGSCQHSCSSR